LLKLPKIEHRILRGDTKAADINAQVKITAGEHVEIEHEINEQDPHALKTIVNAINCESEIETEGVYDQTDAIKAPQISITRQEPFEENKTKLIAQNLYYPICTQDMSGESDGEGVLTINASLTPEVIGPIPVPIPEALEDKKFYFDKEFFDDSFVLKEEKLKTLVLK
jgi:hypothetical protein